MNFHEEGPGAGDTEALRDRAKLDSLLHPQLRPSHHPQQGPAASLCEGRHQFYIETGGQFTPPKDGTLPYGFWELADGTLVLFSRHYTPLWIRHPESTVTKADPNTWFHYKQVNWLHDYVDRPDNNKKVKARLKETLALFTNGRAT